jgi:hypothetical protein
MANLTQDVIHGMHHAEKSALDNTAMFVENLAKALVCIRLTGWLQSKTEALDVPTMECALSVIE